MKQRAWVAGVAIVVGSIACTDVTGAPRNGARDEGGTTIRGRVLNSVTKEPISRALVVLQGANAATFTDDRGQFELSLAEKKEAESGGVRMRLGGGSIEVRKPGFLQGRRLPMIRYTTGPQPEAVIHLIPEALIVGHVEVPGSEGDVRIQCELYRRAVNEGRETWTALPPFSTFVDGEFRFSELEAGTYKLITREQVDPDSMPNGQMYAYPPVYYPNTTDFSLATPITVKAGETARVNLAVARQKYYPVKIAVANMPLGLGLNSVVYPMGHHSPGWSLGYDPGEEAIMGSLPDGNYTVEARAQGEGSMTGILNFSVKGAPVEGPTLTLVPDATIAVRVREEFESGQSNFVTLQTMAENSPPNARRFSNVHVNLRLMDELNLFQQNASSQLPEGSQRQELTITNVGPGRYAVEVTSGVGYAASVQSGGRNLMHHAMVVGLGGGVAPIEVVLRDDGAKIDGELEEGAGGTNLEEARTIYLVPVGETGGQPRTMQAWQGKFTMQQVPPGDYLAVAFAQQPDNLAYGTEEATQALLKRGGKMIHLEAKQDVSVKLQLSEEE